MMEANPSTTGLLVAAIAALTAATPTAMAKAPSELGAPSAAMSGASSEALPLLAQSSQCINGYRTIHVVRGHGRVSQGVILRCRG
jgi:hypothetical protein